MRVGYARVSTTEQNMDAQLERLRDCEKIFCEKQSGRKVDRPELARALEFVREGDSLVSTRLDRLARSVSHLCAIADALAHKQVDLVILDQAIDTSTATGKLLFHVLAAIAEFEASIRLEAQRVGMAHARATGKHLGRPWAMSQEEIARAVQLRHEGVSIRGIAGALGRKRATVARAILQAPDSGQHDGTTG